MHEVILLRIDFIKDFHRVNLWKLFNKLLDDKLHRDITAAGSSLAMRYFPSWFNVCIVSFLVCVIEIVIDDYDCAHGITTMYFRHFNRMLYTIQAIQQ